VAWSALRQDPFECFVEVAIETLPLGVVRLEVAAGNQDRGGRLDDPIAVGRRQVAARLPTDPVARGIRGGLEIGREVEYPRLRVENRPLDVGERLAPHRLDGAPFQVGIEGVAVLQGGNRKRFRFLGLPLVQRAGYPVRAGERGDDGRLRGLLQQLDAPGLRNAGERGGFVALQVGCRARVGTRSRDWWERREARGCR